MGNLKRFSTAIMALGVIGTAFSAPANARLGANDAYFRVAGLDGGKKLSVYARPNAYSRRVTKLDFNARNLLRTGTRRRGRWLRIDFEGQSGWVKRRNLVKDEGGQVYFHVTGVARNGGLKIKSRPRRSSRTRGVLANHTKFVEDLGECRGNWCLVRYQGVRGWVEKHCLISMRRTDAPRVWANGRGDARPWSNNYRKPRGGRIYGFDRFDRNDRYSGRNNRFNRSDRYSGRNGRTNRYERSNRFDRKRRAHHGSRNRNWQNRWSGRSTQSVNTYGYSY